MPVQRTSVAMATCNGAAFVEAQLESLASQTRPPDEIVACDDASEDDTVSRLQGFASRSSIPVRIERNPIRLGATANFERSVSLCTGDVVLLADQDDVWALHKIETLAAVLEDRPEVGLVFSNGAVVDETLAPLGYDLWQALFFDATDRRRVRSGEAPAVFARRVVAAGTTLAFRSRYAPLLHPFPALPSVHDAWIAFLIACVADCALVEEPLVQYRLHDANQVGLRRRGLVGQLQQARRQLARGAFAEEATFFEGARERLTAHGSDFPVASKAMDVIEGKIAHARARDGMPDAWLARWPIVIRELASGRYRAYAYGFKSVAQDLLLR